MKPKKSTGNNQRQHVAVAIAAATAAAAVIATNQMKVKRLSNCPSSCLSHCTVSTMPPPCPPVRGFYNFTGGNHNCRRQLSCCQMLPRLVLQLQLAVLHAACGMPCCKCHLTPTPTRLTASGLAWRVVNNIWPR